MSESPVYIIDANILIESKRVDYGFDICPGFWDLMRKAFERGIVISHEKVYQELKAGGDELWRWASSLPKSCFPRETEADLSVYLDLCSWARGGSFKEAAVSRFCEPDYADPWICAKAKAEGLVLVTQEVSEPMSRKSVKLPDACIFMGVPYCNKYQLLRDLRARFILDENHAFDLPLAHVA